MTLKSKQKKNNQGGESFWNVFVTAVVATFGVLGSFILLSLFSLATISLGIWMIMKNAVEDPKTQKKKIKWNVISVLGSIFIFLGFLPWLPYLFQGFMFNLGGMLAQAFFNAIFPSS